MEVLRTRKLTIVFIKGQLSLMQYGRVYFFQFNSHQYNVPLLSFNLGNVSGTLKLLVGEGFNSSALKPLSLGGRSLEAFFSRWSYTLKSSSMPLPIIHVILRDALRGWVCLGGYDINHIMLIPEKREKKKKKKTPWSDLEIKFPPKVRILKLHTGISKINEIVCFGTLQVFSVSITLMAT